MSFFRGETLAKRVKSLFGADSKSRQVFARRAGIIMMVLAMVLQFSSVFVPSDAQAAGSDDMIPGGVSTKDQILAHYDKNTNNFRDVMTYNGITRAELAAMSATKTRFNIDNGMSWGWTSRFSTAQGQRAHSVAGRTIYSRPQKLWGYSTYTGWEGKSAVRGKFRIMAACGNLVSYALPTPPSPVATCDKLTITKRSRTEFTLSASGSAKNGAKVNEIHYYIYDSNNKAVNAVSTKGSSTTTNFTIKAAGTYTARAYAITTIGNKTSDACAGKITVTQEQKPSISITKTVNEKKHDKVTVGTEFTYEITVKNTGNVELKDAVVTDTAPSEVTLIKGSAGTVKNNKWTYTIPSLKVGESKTFKLTAKYATYSDGTHKNSVCVDTPTVPGGPDACDDATTETYEDLEVCDLKDNTVKTITRKEFNADSLRYTEDKSKCGDMKVCVKTTKEIKTIAKNEYDESTMTTDYSECQDEPEQPQPPVVELPKTGIDAMSGIFGIGGLVSASYAYIASRRNLR